MDAMPRAIYYTQRIQIRPRVILGDQGANYVPGGSRETIFILAGNSNCLICAKKFIEIGQSEIAESDKLLVLQVTLLRLYMK